MAVYLAVSSGFTAGADWLTVKGDQQHSGWQPEETVLNVRTLKKMSLLWTRQLGSEGTRLSDPILLGPIITDRGVKELVFVRSFDRVYAVDADLGMVFWERSLGQRSPASQEHFSPCDSSGSIAPVMNWSESEPKPEATGEDHYSNGNRPMYVLQEGQIHVLRPATGGDLRGEFPLVPAGSYASTVDEKAGVLYALGSGKCNAVPDRLWSKEVGASGLELERAVQASAFNGLPGQTALEWNGQKFVIELKTGGEPVLRAESALQDRDYGSGAVATWQDKTKARWIYTSANNTVTGFRVENGATGPVVQVAWRLQKIYGSGAPVVANGVVYFLSRLAGAAANRLVLQAVDAENGTELFRSGEVMFGSAASAQLAIANGHVCFSGAAATLRCFGLPFTM